MIRSWNDRDAKRLFGLERPRRLPAALHRTALRKLRMLDAATNIDDLRITPANCLEKLSGNRSGQWRIRISDQWRICSTWREGNASGVQLVARVLRGNRKVLRDIRVEMEAWMNEHEYESLESMRGCMNILRSPNPNVYSRANYMRVLQTWVNE